ncbi:MAG TPA: O-antigen ligase family protein [Chloroflexia bacterium]
MLTRVGQYADRVLEMGWLGAAIMVPLFFNVYSSRVFEPDKISALRSLVLIMLAAWIIKLVEAGYRAVLERNAEAAPVGRAGRGGRAAAAVGGAARSGLPDWLGILRVPMLIPILAYALVYLVSSILSVTPYATFFGSYQRLQGTYSQYSYMLLAILVIANLRTRAQFERLINFMLLASLPVALYGLLQANRLDPLPWAGDTATRVASSMGNAIFVAAWLIMVVPFAAYRLFVGLSASIAARQASRETTDAPLTDAERRKLARARASEAPGYGWAVVTGGLAIIFIQIFSLFTALKIAAGLPLPDASTWWVLPFGLVVFFAGCWGLEWLGNNRDNPSVVSPMLPILGVTLFLVTTVALVFNWTIERSGPQGQEQFGAAINMDGGAFLWVMFFMLLWGTVGAGAYALAGSERMSGNAGPDRGILRAFLNAGYGLLIFLQLICIYLSQSRGPWLGFGASLVTFVVGMWLVGRRRNIRWMARIGGTVSALALVAALFVAALNIPGSPLKALDNLPVVGRGIERLSTLTQTDVGTGRVRDLIWEGAARQTLHDPLRAVLGWGPESMYVAYNPFYPPQLAQVELRNATPDRSHNVEFDHLVTMGVVGLVAYYFLVGSFYFLAIKALKRATGVRDSLLLLALLSAMTAHFVEIQTGIQIASTWTYFYLIVAQMVVFGYFLNPYLRRETVAEDEYVPVAVPAGAAVLASEAVPVEDARPVAAGRGASRGAAAATVQVAQGGNGRASQGSRGRASTSAANGQSRTGTGQTSDGRRGQGQGVRRHSTERNGDGRYSNIDSDTVSNPLMLVLYGGLMLGAILLGFFWNASGVQADTIYKQGQAYDSAARWPEAIQLYETALRLQPEQDYYYLFLGRAWLEFAKQARSETQGNVRTRVQYPNSDKEASDPAIAQSNNNLRKAEEIERLRRAEQTLRKANQLSPLNSDHYANLGRLYLWWADPTGGNDASKGPQAVQELEMAATRSPGNAQIRDELAVAYARNGQFDKSMETLRISQEELDPTFARTPFIRSQLLGERAGLIRGLLDQGQPLPTEGETDYGKLMLELGRAYSETIALDPATVIDNNFATRIDALLEATAPYTRTNTTLPEAQVTNIVTNTVMRALENELVEAEENVTRYLRERGAFTGTDQFVPNDVLLQLFQDPTWAVVQGENSTQVWRDPNMVIHAHRAAILNFGLGYVYGKLGRPGHPTEAVVRATALEPYGNFQMPNTPPQQQSPQP